MRKNDLIVVYDKIGMVSAPRAYWLFKTFGVPNVRILNGTFSKWISESRPVDQGDEPSAWSRVGRKTSPGPEDFNFHYNDKRVRFFEDMVEIIKHNKRGD